MRKKITAEKKASLAAAIEEAKAAEPHLLASIYDYDRSLAQQYGYYKTLLFDLGDYDRSWVIQALDATAKAYQGGDPLTASMKRSLLIVIQDVNHLLAGRNDQLNLENFALRSGQ
jgi:hypothetical protein